MKGHEPGDKGKEGQLGVGGVSGAARVAVCRSHSGHYRSGHCTFLTVNLAGILRVRADTPYGAREMSSLGS